MLNSSKSGTPVPIEPRTSTPVPIKKPDPLLDPATFGSLGGKSEIDKQMDDLFNDNESCDCKQEAYVRDQVLPAEWDRAVSAYSINAQGRADLEDMKKKMLDDSWWERSSGPDIAIGVKQACDTFDRVLDAIPVYGAAKLLGRTGAGVTKQIGLKYRTAKDVLDALELGEKANTLVKARCNGIR